MPNKEAIALFNLLAKADTVEDAEDAFFDLPIWQPYENMQLNELADMILSLAQHAQKTENQK